MVINILAITCLTLYLLFREQPAKHSALSASYPFILFLFIVDGWFIWYLIAEEKDFRNAIKDLSNEKELKRQIAAAELGNMLTYSRVTGYYKAVNPLLGALLDSDPVVRARAAIALGKIGDPRAIEPLKAALKDSDSTVRKAVAEALKKIEEAQARLV